MRRTRRTIILLGCIGFIALYALQYRVALAVTPLILVVGVVAGLAIAKWLPWAWYGRQFAAGVRAGAVACGLSAAGVLLSLVGSGPHTVSALASRSRLPGVDLTGIVTGLSSAGWFTPYLLLSVFFALGGTLAAGLVAQVAGWSKSQRTVRVISQAHNAAATFHRAQTWAPATNSMPSISGYWNSVIPSAGPLSHPGALATSATHAASRAAMTHGPVSGTPIARDRWITDSVLERESSYLAALPPLGFEAAVPLAPLPPAPEPIPPRRTDSGAHPVQFAMTEDLRKALDEWESDPHPEDAIIEEPDASPSTKPPAVSRAKTPSKRQPKASSYLNSQPAATPRRSRKKQNTRDWLC